MADENKKDYYTKLFNPLLEALFRSDFSGSEYKVILFVIRSTYGWNKKKFPLSKNYIANGINMEKRNACRTIRSLVKKNVLIEYGVDKETRSVMYGLNKHYSQWDVEGVKNDTIKNSKNEGVKNDDICVSKMTLSEGVQNDTIDSVKNDTQKRNSKRNIKKEKEKKYTVDSDFFLDENGNWQPKGGGQ